MQCNIGISKLLNELRKDAFPRAYCFSKTIVRIEVMCFHLGQNMVAVNGHRFDIIIVMMAVQFLVIMAELWMFAQDAPLNSTIYCTHILELDHS